jgi:tetratricopeptide (TPR) repeat protein
VLEEGVGRGTLQAGTPWVRELSALVNGRVAEDRGAIAGLRTQAMAAANGTAARSLGDVYYGYGQYGDAAALYRTALQKGGEDSNLVNIRLGAALALAGQRAEAEAAFRAVTGPRAELAQFWLLWLSTRG